MELVFLKCISPEMCHQHNAVLLPPCTHIGTCNEKKYDRPVVKLPFAVTRVVAERRSTPMQWLNDFMLVLQHPDLAGIKKGELTIISDGGWDHQPRNSEVRFALTLEHVVNQRNYTGAFVRAVGLLSYNEAERQNGAETQCVQKACLKEVVLLPADDSLPAKEALVVRRRRFQNVLVAAISGGMYAGQPIRRSVSNPTMAGFDVYGTKFRTYIGTVLDGKADDVPLDVRGRIANVQRYLELHHFAGYYSFQLRRTHCLHTVKHLCIVADYPFPLVFKTCSELGDLGDVAHFVDDPLMGPSGEFQQARQVLLHKAAEGIHTLKADPPSVVCKAVYEKNPTPSEAELCALAETALENANKVDSVREWFAKRRLQAFSKAEDKMKRRCGQVELGVLGDVEHLLRQSRGCLGLNGQCTAHNLKRVLGAVGLVCSGPKAELVQHVYNHNHTIRDFLGLQVEVASVEISVFWLRMMGKRTFFASTI